MRLNFVRCLIFIVFASGFAEAQEQYFAIFMDGQKVGHAIHDRAVEQNKATTTDAVELTLSQAAFH
jgi:hypothetical protein